ncbi:EAL domain-containing protein [Coleofasciculus sp. FACHB-SPT36]|uniref:EAL domain-containing protein n=1 Tax=Cyanophyceae TaxID=3028117 RepID=UPI00168BB3C7|nr:EAL domain-containing protein [Coleofasciculus sp. FACHB-SPT36]MBD2538954.1 EAL domain-containing protein [Coleofasciculus sp. FACHB-SPT36]
MKISHKLMTGYLAVALLVEVVGYVGIKETNNLEKKYNEVINRTIPFRYELERLQYVSDTVVLYTKQLEFQKVEKNPSAKDIVSTQKYQNVETSQENYRKALNDYKELANYFFTSEQGLSEEIQTSSERFLKLSNEVIGLKKQEKVTPELLEKENELEKTSQQFIGTINQKIQTQSQELETERKKIHETLLLTDRMIFGVGLSTVLIAIFLGLSISRSILSRLNKLKAAAVEIGQGKLETKIDVSTKDELSALADAFNKMAEDLRQKTADVINVCESMVESLIVVTPDTMIQSVNKATCELLGYHKEELIGQPIRVIFADEKFPFTASELDNLTQKRVVRDAEKIYLSKDGRRISVLFSCAAIASVPDRIQGIVCVAQDITERQRAELAIKQAKEELEIRVEERTTELKRAIGQFQGEIVERQRVEEALRESEERFRTLIQELHVGVLLQGANAEILLSNQAAIDLLGITDSQLLGKTSFDLDWNVIHEDGTPFPGETHPVSQAIATRQAVRNVVMGVYRPSVGDRIWLLVNAEPQLAADGRLEQVICTFSDITKRKQAEERLAQRERYLSALVEVERRLLTFDGSTNCYTEILVQLGQAAGASRVYVFENHRSQIGNLLMSQRAEWCAEGVRPEIDNPALQNLSYDDFFPRWAYLLEKGDIVAGIVAELPESERFILEPQGILSILILPIMVKGEFFGFIGFDNCIEARAWEPLEINLLRAAAAAISLTQERKQAEEAVTRLAGILEATSDFVGSADNRGRAFYINQAGRRLVGIPLEEDISNLSVASCHPKWAGQIILEEGIPSAIRDGVWCGETALLTRDKREIPVLQLIIAHKKPDGSVDFLSTISRDISDRKQAENALKQLNADLEKRVLERTAELNNAIAQLEGEIAERKWAEEELEKSLSLLKATLESTADGILVVDKTGKIASFNQKFVQMWRIPDSIVAAGNSNQALAFVLEQLKNPETFITKIQELYSEPDAESYDLLEFKDRRIFERYSQPQRIGGKVVGRVWSFRDVTERQQAEETIRYQALHDLLTGLPNRMLFNERLSVSLAYARQSQSTLAVMFLDLDRFKTINDTLGHAFGDRLLQSVTERMIGCLGEDDTVARWGGDEFTLLIPQIRCKEDAAKIAQKILEALKPEFYLEGHSLHISSSIGIALYPSDGTDAETLLRNADAALYRAKEQGRNNYQFYNPAMNSQNSELLVLENDLHHALERGEFVVYYQPQVNTTTGEITHVEALLRWQHPKFGLVSPGIFIPLAEETGLIVPIGEWVLKTACTQNKAWHDAGFADLQVAVNLSARQFQEPDLVKMVTRILEETGLEAPFLELEITETITMQNVEFTRKTLSELHRLGVYISLDDFGTGYSSLTYLKKFPFHTLKIDKSFVRDLTSDPNDAAIITAIAALGKVLNLRLVAEGVETEAQKDFLQNLQCEQMQGYFFWRPQASEEITKILEKSFSKIAKHSSCVSVANCSCSFRLSAEAIR